MSIRGVLALFGVFALAGVVQQARADTYTIFKVASSSGSIYNYGLSEDGSLVTYSYGSQDYSVFSPLTGTSTTSFATPALQYDNGHACVPTVSGAPKAIGGRCNVGYSLLQGYAGSNVFPDLYRWDGSTLDDLFHGGADNLLLNRFGDFAFVANTGSLADTNILFYDVTTHMTPEPESLALAMSGCTALVLAWKRKRLAQQ